MPTLNIFNAELPEAAFTRCDNNSRRVATNASANKGGPGNSRNLKRKLKNNITFINKKVKFLFHFNLVPPFERWQSNVKVRGAPLKKAKRSRRTRLKSKLSKQL